MTGGLRGVAPVDGRRDGRGDEDHLVLLEQTGAGKGAVMVTMGIIDDKHSVRSNRVDVTP